MWEFNVKAKVILNRNGYSIKHPKEDYTRRRYKKCVQKKLDEGVSMKQIEMARKEYVR